MQAVSGLKAILPCNCRMVGFSLVLQVHFICASIQLVVIVHATAFVLTGRQPSLQAATARVQNTELTEGLQRNMYLCCLQVSQLHALCLPCPWPTGCLLLAAGPAESHVTPDTEPGSEAPSLQSNTPKLSMTDESGQ